MLTSDFNSVLSHNAGKLLIECSSTFTTIFIRVLNFIITSIYLCLRFSLQLYKTGNLVVKICTWYIFIFKLKIFSIFLCVCVLVWIRTCVQYADICVLYRCICQSVGMGTRGQFCDVSSLVLSWFWVSSSSNQVAQVLYLLCTLSSPQVLDVIIEYCFLKKQIKQYMELFL